MADVAINPSASELWPPEHYLPRDPTLSALLLLRERKPAPAWEQVAAALKMGARILRRWRWLAAAELRAQGWGWTEIASHPAVDFNADTLRKEHGKVKLPNGLSFEEHVAAYQAALISRGEQLQEERGAQAAERIYLLGQKALDTFEQLQDLVGDYLQHPPAIFTPNAMPVEATEKSRQQLINFPSPSGAPVAENKTPLMRITPAFARYLTNLQTELIKGLGAADLVLVKHKPVEDEEPVEDNAPATQAEMEALIARHQRQGAEMLRLLREEGAA